MDLNEYPMFSENIDQLVKDLALLQKEIPNPPKSAAAAGQKYKYATLDDCLDIAKKFLPKFGFSFTQLIKPPKILVTYLFHSSGQWIASYDPIEDVNISTRDGKFTLNPMQSYGSGKTYARRIGLVSVLGIVGEDDDDAHSLSAQPTFIHNPIVNEFGQILQKLKDLCKNEAISVPDFCTFHNIRTGDPESIKNAVKNFDDLKERYIQEKMMG